MAGGAPAGAQGLGEQRRRRAPQLVDVVLVLEQEPQGRLDQRRLQPLGAQVGERRRPVQGLGHPGQFVEVLGPQPLDEGHHLVGEPLREPGHLAGDDLDLLVQRRVVDPVVDAPPLEGVVDLAGAVGGDHRDRLVLGHQGADLGHRHLEVGEQLEQEALELLVGAVELVDEQHRRPLVAGVDGLQQRPLEQELLAEDVTGDPPGPLAGVAAGLDLEQLPRVVPLVDRLAEVEALVALEADERRQERPAQDLGDLGLAHPRLALEEQRLLHPEGQEKAGRQPGVGDVVVPRQRLGGAVDGVEHLAPASFGGTDQATRRPDPDGRPRGLPVRSSALS